jgi:hypothetical protein
MREALVSVLQAEKRQGMLTGDLCHNAVDRLITNDSSDRFEIAERMLEAFQCLSEGLAAPLILVVDQAEEVLTLGATKDGRTEQKAFFGLLEELCCRNLAVKVVLALRTEYYGQFCDHFSVAPNSKVSISRTALDQYLLHGLRSLEQIVAAIERPTSRTKVGDFGVPYEVYQFEFSRGVAKNMALDLIRHCGESSILPVLQIVCQDLYSKVVLKERQKIITMAHYEALGKVDGRVNAFIENAITGVLEERSSRKPNYKEVAAWQDVLSSMVARQEGGALTSLIVSRSELLVRARNSGIKHPEPGDLEEMAQDKWRLLREISPSTGSAAVQYSLGHDALAPALLRWRFKKDGSDTEKKRTRWKIGLVVAAAALATLVLSSFSLFLTYIQRSDKVQYERYFSSSI